MPEHKPRYGIYIGDVHGARLSNLWSAMDHLGIVPDFLLCTMDLDQVLSIRELRTFERRFAAQGKDAWVVPGNHEAAIILGIEIDSGTYRKKKQNTNIRELTEDINREESAGLRQYVAQKLETVGGERVPLDESGSQVGLLIHGALKGKQEKYLHEFPEDLRNHVKSRGDLWLRIEERRNIGSNFTAMKKAGVHAMFRGHDHYLAIRSQDEKGHLRSHQVVCHQLPLSGEGYQIEDARGRDKPDEVVEVASGRLEKACAEGDIYWETLNPGFRYVINFGPYFDGYFGLIRSGVGGEPPAVASMRVKTTFFTAEERMQEYRHSTIGQQARSGKSFYDLFRR